MLPSVVLSPDIETTHHASSKISLLVTDVSHGTNALHSTIEHPRYREDSGTELNKMSNNASTDAPANAPEIQDHGANEPAEAPTVLPS